MAVTKTEQAKTICDAMIAYGIASARVWQGGDKIRVYYGKKSDYLEVGNGTIDARKLNHYGLYSHLQELGLTEFECDTTNYAQMRQTLNRSLDYEMENPNGIYYG